MFNFISRQTESWAGPGNEANVRYCYDRAPAPLRTFPENYLFAKKCPLSQWPMKVNEGNCKVNRGYSDGNSDTGGWFEGQNVQSKLLCVSVSSFRSTAEIF